MKTRPILFSGEMVRAMLEGRKTQTRRIISPTLPSDVTEFAEMPAIDRYLKCMVSGSSGIWSDCHGLDEVRRCPFGVAGDQLYVRETVKVNGTMAGPRITYRADGAEVYRSDLPDDCDAWVADDHTWRPSILAPRWASRIVLDLKSIRAERLQDISQEDALAEGLPDQLGDRFMADLPARYRYHQLWDSINGRGSWYENPWVWVINFRRIM
jgi:hypothetical protein